MADIILEAKELCFSYGNKQVLQVAFKIEEGCYTSIIGPNGSGKTTLLRLLYGECKGKGKGEVIYRGESIQKMSVGERARNFAVVRQNEENRFPFTCLEMVLLGLHPFRSRFGEISIQQKKYVYELMKETECLMLADKSIMQISGGEFQRVLLARALVQHPKILFLDEAMSELDINAKISMTKLLRRLAAQNGLTIIAVSHDLHITYQYSDRIIALHSGEIAAYGIPTQVMNSNFFESVFGVKAKIIPGNGFVIHDNI